ncbi:DUF2850 domain-containing protein [Vibrio sp. TH_r3]|uniref:DUF2850 domain-containing protein n=1 Tax=Vibrio sp. TH_r3 TaxID=3082084 RepID=UPI0029535B9D|nr:DUF2850 domain-containing protein [Vibrio sp. TH_r3]MDV7106191.1 DUF2850 domain-containing protein [Vibrio sp. TH_r3]
MNKLTKNKTGQDVQQKHERNYIALAIILLVLSTMSAASYFTYISYKNYIDPSRVYGKWTEIGAPSWQTDRFSLSADGVVQNSRFIASSFDFDGSIVTYTTGEERYQLQIFGQQDERLTRISGGGHTASFIKNGYEDTLPDQDNIGPARRVSLAEHFRSKK